MFKQRILFLTRVILLLMVAAQFSYSANFLNPKEVSKYELGVLRGLLVMNQLLFRAANHNGTGSNASQITSVNQVENLGRLVVLRRFMNYLSNQMMPLMHSNSKKNGQNSTNTKEQLSAETRHLIKEITVVLGVLGRDGIDFSQVTSHSAVRGSIAPAHSSGVLASSTINLQEFLVLLSEKNESIALRLDAFNLKPKNTQTIWQKLRGEQPQRITWIDPVLVNVSARELSEYQSGMIEVLQRLVNAGEQMHLTSLDKLREHSAKSSHSFSVLSADEYKDGNLRALSAIASGYRNALILLSQVIKETPEISFQKRTIQKTAWLLEPCASKLDPLFDESRASSSGVVTPVKTPEDNQWVLDDLDER